MSPFDLAKSNFAIHVIPPEFTLSMAYEKSSVYERNTDWATFLRADIYKDARLVLCSGSSTDRQAPSSNPPFNADNDMGNLEMTTFELFDVEELLRLVKASGASTNLPLRRRNAHRLQTPPLVSGDYENESLF